MRRFRSVDEKRDAVERYFADNERPTLTGLAMVFDMGRQELADYVGRDRIVLHARARVEAYYESRSNMAGSTQGSLHILKTQFGWDRPQAASRGKARRPAEMSTDELAAYLMRSRKS